MEEQLKQLITETLSIDCDSVIDDLKVPCATYDFYMTNPVLFGNGINTEEEESVQIDLWYKSKDRMNRDADKLHSVLKEQKNYTYPYIERYYDGQAELYRATFKLNILKEKEM